MTTADRVDTRDGWRREIAELLELDPAALRDEARLTDELGLDSMAMMTLFGWLETKGISAVNRDRLRRVGDILGLLARLPARLSVVLADAREEGPASTAGLLPAHRRSTLAPVLDTAAYRLTPIQESDLDFLYLLATHPETGYRWRYRGNPPSRPGSPRATRPSARCSPPTTPARDGPPRSRPCSSGTCSTPSGCTSSTWRCRGSTGRGGVGRLFQVEGVLRDHDFHAGRYWDKRVCAIYPELTSSPGDPGS